MLPGTAKGATAPGVKKLVVGPGDVIQIKTDQDMVLYEIHGTAGQGDIDAIQERLVDWITPILPNRTLHGILSKLVMEEIPELLKEPNESEFADCVILLLDAAHILGFRPSTAILDKMAVNEQRTWTLDPDKGLMHHDPQVPNR